MDRKKLVFSGKLGFVLATAGSAVGLGNIWRFPYLAAKHGGGIFLLVYVLLAVTFGFVLMTTEIAIGRKTNLSAIGAYKKLNNKFSFLGYLASFVPMIVLPYYCVIGGWVTKYFVDFISGKALLTTATGYFDAFIQSTGEPILWFSIYLFLTASVVFFGVEKGIEKVSKVMMPVLVFLIIFVAGYSMFLPGAMEGVKYYLTPDFSHFSITTVLAAMGQLFYSMSIAMGILITYGSYMKKDVDIESSVKQIEIFDTGVAFLAGLIIVPAVFVFSGGDKTMLTKGPSLMFVTLPKVFETMPGGTYIGALFFILVLLAALTSSISLMETVVSIIRDKFDLKRNPACLLVMAGCMLIGLPSALGYGLLENIKPLGMAFLDFFDFISNSVLMPVVAFLSCIFVAYIIKPKTITDEVELTGKFKFKKLYLVVIKYIAPVCIILILVSSVMEALGILKV